MHLLTVAGRWLRIVITPMSTSIEHSIITRLDVCEIPELIKFGFTLVG